MSVIDAAERFSHCQRVITHEDIREELIRQLEAKILKGKDVAAYLKTAPARITELKKRERRVQQHETVPLVELLKMEGEIAPERPSLTLSMPVQFPNEDELIGMFEGMLQAAGQPKIAAELAPQLAQLLPGALMRAQGLEPPRRSPADETFPDEDPPRRAKGRRAPPPPPST